MTHLIDKDALVAEIERRIKRFREEKDSVSIVKTNTYKGIFSFINTLEVKEVDLDKEISFQWPWFCLNDKDRKSFVKVAKHFFELGLKAQKDEMP